MDALRRSVGKAAKQTGAQAQGDRIAKPRQAEDAPRQAGATKRRDYSAARQPDASWRATGSRTIARSAILRARRADGRAASAPRRGCARYLIQKHAARAAALRLPAGT